MQWKERAIVLHLTPLGESGHIVTVLSETHGLHKGLLRRRKKTPGDLVQALWTARLPEQLGTWILDTEISYSAFVLRDPLRLGGLMLYCELLRKVLTERTPCSDVFQKAYFFLDRLRFPTQEWVLNYLFLEFFLLSKVGFGLDFRDTHLASESDPLAFVSPKTGRIVTQSKGMPYRDRLLRLPSFLLNESSPLSGEALDDAFRLTEFFFEKNRLPASEHASFYQARSRLKQTLLKSLSCE